MDGTGVCIELLADCLSLQIPREQDVCSRLTTAVLFAFYMGNVHFSHKLHAYQEVFCCCLLRSYIADTAAYGGFTAKTAGADG